MVWDIDNKNSSENFVINTVLLSKQVNLICTGLIQCYIVHVAYQILYLNCNKSYLNCTELLEFYRVIWMVLRFTKTVLKVTWMVLTFNWMHGTELFEWYWELLEWYWDLLKWYRVIWMVLVFTWMLLRFTWKTKFSPYTLQIHFCAKTCIKVWKIFQTMRQCKAWGHYQFFCNVPVTVDIW